jgi:hypothetical protein
MRVLPIVIKFFGYLWFTIQIVLVQFEIVSAFYEAFIQGVDEPGMSLRYAAWMVIVAMPGAALLIAANKLREKLNTA